MFQLYRNDSARKTVSDHSALIDSICASYRLPSAYLKAILLTELPEINVFDFLADSLVHFNWFRYTQFHAFRMERHTRNPMRKFDSSTGYGQIFSQVAIEAILFAQSRGIPLFLGISHTLSGRFEIGLETAESGPRVQSLLCRTEHHSCRLSDDGAD